MTHIYAFGSVCRGEVTPESDIDLLAITQEQDQRFNPDQYSIYSHARLAEIWDEGSPFAWHLSLEAKLIYSTDGSDYLQELGVPAAYHSAAEDCQKFFTLFKDSAYELRSGTNSLVFELSTVFLAMRNFATCYLLGVGIPDFSRHSILRFQASNLVVSKDVFAILERARLICTRGVGDTLSQKEVGLVTIELEAIENWMRSLLMSVQKS